MMTNWLKTTLEEAQANLSLAQSRPCIQANKSCRDKMLEVGEEVVISTSNLNINQQLPAKLGRCWVGPFKIAKVISPVAYVLDLPTT